MFTLRLC